MSRQFRSNKLFWCSHIGWFNREDPALIQSIVCTIGKFDISHEFLKSGEFEFCPICGRERPITIAFHKQEISDDYATDSEQT
jgi:hypothetical protein